MSAVNCIDRLVTEMLPHRHHVCNHVRLIALTDVDAQLSPAWAEKVRMHGGLPAAYMRLEQCKMQREPSILRGENNTKRGAGGRGREEKGQRQDRVAGSREGYHNALLLCRFAYLTHVPR